MAEAPRPIIIVKRKKVVAGGAHGGAWKIAYADFVTAMMAFFLLMWLLGITEEVTRGGIADYFKTPIKAAVLGKKGTNVSVIELKGGGKDAAEAKQGLTTNKTKALPIKEINVNKAKEALKREEMKKMESMKAKLDQLIEINPKLTPFKNQLLIDITSEGLRVQIVDEKNRPMFALSSAELSPTARTILLELAKTLNELPNRISLSGHTDAKPFANGGQEYTNWELSSERANEARRVLIQGGMLEDKLLRVIGLSSSVLLDAQDALNPINRRISIILLNKQAEESAQSEGSRQTVNLKDPRSDDDESAPDANVSKVEPGQPVPEVEAPPAEINQKIVGGNEPVKP
ncbi:MAG: flagellar motor protein MotB [Methylococcales bacterium]